MSWIRALGYEESEGRLRELYDRVRGPGGQIDAILRLHSLRPHTLEGHLALYKAVLHHVGNRLPRPLLEALGAYVSLLNGCDYCVEHHFAGLRRLVGDEEHRGIRRALERRRPQDVFDPREAAAFRYAERLTLEPGRLTREDVEELREAGLEDGEVLEVNQVVAYFAYANRTVLGLGGSAAGETLGLSPRDKTLPEDWSHS
ncbi:MAG: carboxymuconolactone decarboxylase family protein [Gemmatimonadota bacterium]